MCAGEQQLVTVQCKNGTAEWGHFLAWGGSMNVGGITEGESCGGHEGGQKQQA